VFGIFWEKYIISSNYWDRCHQSSSF